MVKAKLIEIGEYIDDQLTDYVMIMVANKKTEKQMAEDLELFLGGKDQSTSFSSWYVIFAVHFSNYSGVCLSLSFFSYHNQASRFT
jgi:hypothetical protein